MRIVGMVLAATLLLSACSSDPAPKEPTPTDPSTTPTRALPTMPPQASQDSPEGAAAFVKHYVDVFNYAAATGDVEELTRLSSPDCDGCQSYIKLYQKTYEAGGYFRGGDWTVGDLRLEHDEAETFATTDVSISPTTYRESDNAHETTGPTESSTITFGVIGVGSTKHISQLALGGA